MPKITLKKSFLGHFQNQWLDPKVCADLSWLLVLKNGLKKHYSLINDWVIDVWSWCKKCDRGKKGREGKGREGKGREGKGSEAKDQLGFGALIPLQLSVIAGRNKSFLHWLPTSNRHSFSILKWNLNLCLFSIADSAFYIILLHRSIVHQYRQLMQENIVNAVLKHLLAPLFSVCHTWLWQYWIYLYVSLSQLSVTDWEKWGKQVFQCSNLI